MEYNLFSAKNLSFHNIIFEYKNIYYFCNKQGRVIQDLYDNTWMLQRVQNLV